jgi:hypothetical protein
MTSRRFLSLTVSSFLLWSASAIAQCNTQDSTAPCFANVPDILNGRQSVLQDDDLVVNGTFADAATLRSVAAGRIGYTNNSEITSHVTAPSPVSYSTSNVAAVKGRMFSLKNDRLSRLSGWPNFQVKA